MDILSKRTKSVKKRSFSFLKSQKPSIDPFPEDKSRYYDFVDIPVFFRPASPLIDRQKISSKEKSELHRSCTLLLQSIAKGIPSQCISELQPVNADKQTIQTLTGTESTKKVLSPSNYLSPNIGSIGANRRGKCDSAVELESQKPSPREADISRFSNSESGSNSRSSTVGCSSVQSIKSPVVNPIDGNESFQSQTSPTLLCEETPSEKNEGQNSADIEGFLNPDSSSELGRVPSLSRPQATPRLSRKPCFENLQAATPGDSQRNSTLSDCSEPIQLTEYPKRPATAIELGVSYHRERNHGGVIIDSSGLLHVMSAEEETQRRIDLQRAVMEKMSTGTISTGPRPTFSHADNPRMDNFTNPRNNCNSNEQPGKGKSLLHKLSLFGLGKRKTNSRNRDTLGFSRMVDAL